MPRLLVGTMAYNAHVQHMVLALHQQHALTEYVTGGVDCFSRGVSQGVRQALRVLIPRLSRELERRAVAVPCDVVRTRWRWELPRVVANRAGARRAEDWWWERGELALDRHCARRLASPLVDGFLGVEHGALRSLQAARRLGKPGLVAFLSPHRNARRRWVDAEYANDASLHSSSDAALDALSARRDTRRDEEAAAADWVVAGSTFTARTLAEAGVPWHKLLVVPPGGPEPISERELPAGPAGPLRVIAVGTSAVHKGTHLLLQAWRHVAVSGMELHLYGQVKLPPAVLRVARLAPGGDAIFVHGSVPGATLPAIYRAADVLVFPTLCDGFGMVVSEAFANGLPVITTTNAGAADLVSDRENGLIVPPANVDALVDALRWCAGHRDELFAMRRLARQAAAGRTWAHFRDDFSHVISAVLEGQSPAVAHRLVSASA